MFANEVWLTPLILLPGVALLIVSTSARFGQIHTEIHHLLEHPDDHSKIVARKLLRRSRLFRDSLFYLYASVVLFALGSVLGAVVNLWRPSSLWVVGSLTILGIVGIVLGAFKLLCESRLCLDVLEDLESRISRHRAGEPSE